MKKPEEVFYWRCIKGPKLTDKQFEEMVETGLSKECKGIWCTMYADWDNSMPLAWDTVSWNTESYFSPTPDNVLHFLQFYATQYVVRNITGISTINLDDYVTFRLVTTTVTHEV